MRRKFLIFNPQDWPKYEIAPITPPVPTPTPLLTTPLLVLCALQKKVVQAG